MRIKTIYFIVIFTSLILGSCKDDKLTESIFDTTQQELDPKSYSYKLDYFLEENYRKPYNLKFLYKMQDIGADMEYNLIPATMTNSKKMAVLVKYLWFDVYKKVVGPEFLKQYGPRIIHLIGSPAYNPANGTIILGLAEGGLKVSLFKVNSMDPSDIDMMNEYYFQTMHHEFAHILHQNKNYPKEFNLISYKNYNPFNWSDRDYRVAASLGFVSSYAGSQTREDFVETIATYIVKTDAQWNEILANASKGWVITEDENGPVIKEVPDEDKVDGAAVILNKLSICRTWLKEAWNVDLDALRAEVQARQSKIDMDALLKEIDK